MDASHDRQLTALQVQRLRQNAPLELKDEQDPLSPYLPWLEEDAELAQKVADAWNTLITREDPRPVPACSCSTCNEWRRNL